MSIGTGLNPVKAAGDVRPRKIAADAPGPFLPGLVICQDFDSVSPRLYTRSLQVLSQANSPLGLHLHFRTRSENGPDYGRPLEPFLLFTTKDPKDTKEHKGRDWKMVLPTISSNLGSARVIFEKGSRRQENAFLHVLVGNGKIGKRARHRRLPWSAAGRPARAAHPNAKARDEKSPSPHGKEDGL